MQKKKLRVMENMPLETKSNYFKILFAMAAIDEPVNQLEIVALYRLMAKFKCPDTIRMELISFMQVDNYDLEGIYTLIFEGLDDQEKNILRFSLMKDLLIIMGADYYEGLDKVQLYNEVKKSLYITDEQLQLIEEEYEKDKKCFMEHNQSSYIKNVAKGLIPVSLGLSVPLTLIYIHQGFKRRKIRYKGRRLSSVVLGKYLLLGITCGKAAEWMLKKEDRKGYKFNKQLLIESNKIHGRAKDYLNMDITSLQKRIYNDKGQKIHAQIELLKKASAMLEATEPILI